uniref:Uncharacterized protein n=1 Tax=Arundo donax TaxID=35708 RepID=A0A0A9AN03_ARUDO
MEAKHFHHCQCGLQFIWHEATLTVIQ